MGGAQSRFIRGTDLSPEELQEYEETTFFTKGEIVELRQQYLDHMEDTTSERISMERMITIDLLHQNPFKKRIVQIFSSEEGIWGMNFDDFLTMCSAFSSRAPKQLKIQAAYKLYDFDDGFINKEDIRMVVRTLSEADTEASDAWSKAPQSLSEEQLDEVAQQVSLSCDVDAYSRHKGDQ
jgi:calcium and integrin-binding protein 1